MQRFSSPPVFWTAGSESFRVATGTSTISWTRERSAPMLWSLLTSLSLLGSGDPTEPWGSEFGWTVKAKPVCVCVSVFPCSCGASCYYQLLVDYSYYFWLHTWPCPALPIPAPAGRGLCSKLRLGKHRFVRTLTCPGVFSKFVIIIRIIIDFYRLSSLVFFSVMFFFFGFFLLKKKKKLVCF